MWLLESIVVLNQVIDLFLKCSSWPRHDCTTAMEISGEAFCSMFATVRNEQFTSRNMRPTMVISATGVSIVERAGL